MLQYPTRGSATAGRDRLAVATIQRIIVAYLKCDKCKKAGVARLGTAPIAACCPSCGAFLYAKVTNVALQREQLAVFVSDLVVEINKSGKYVATLVGP